MGRLLNHRSVREYSDQPVGEELVQGLIAAAQSAATSSNLQLWSVVSVQEPERRHALFDLCSKQKQIVAAPWFFAFFADHYRLKRAAAQVGEQALGLDYEEFYAMALIDVALAAERMVCAAELLGLGICYIGALRNHPDAIRELLNLPEGTFGTFGLCVGYPAEISTASIKPRLAQEAVWFRERYDQGLSVEEYDARMSAFYEAQAMKGEVTWSMRSGRRVDEHHLNGREVLRDFVTRQGFSRR